ncbi:Asparagine-rich protein (ARP protein) [Trifolium repens]|nr:Asparagine-rich protein (ARP protein) [Trifolium repens]
MSLLRLHEPPSASFIARFWRGCWPFRGLYRKCWDKFQQVPYRQIEVARRISSKIKDEVYKDNIQTKFDVNDGIHKHHILGKIGKRLKPENQESNDGRKYTRGDMYGPSHKRSNGSFVNAEAQKKSVSDMDAPTRG